jgi:ABC-2 type transport system permease protein
MNAYFRLTRATLKEILRERSTFFWNFVFPLLFITVFGLIFGNGEAPSFKIGLVSANAGGIAQQIDRAIADVSIFEVHEGDFDTELAALRKGDRRAVVVVNASTVAVQPAASPPKIDIYFDPSAQTADQVVLPVLREVVDDVVRKANGQPELYQLELHSIAATNLRQIDYMTPGILAYSILQVGLFAALPLIILRENKVLKRLSATPLSRRTIVASQVTTRVLIAGMQLAVIVGFARLVFGVQTGSDLPLLIGLVVLGALTFVSMGYAVSSFAKTQEGVMPLVQIISFPMLFLSGVFFPLDVLPGFLRPVASFLPLTFLADALRQVTVGGPPVHPLLVDIGVLAGWLAISFLAAVRYFRWT